MHHTQKPRGSHWADSFFCTSSLPSSPPSYLSYPALSPEVTHAARIRPCPLKVSHRKGLRWRESLGTGLCTSDSSHHAQPKAGLFSSQSSFPNFSQQEGLAKVLARSNHLSLIPEHAKMPGKPTPTSCPLTYADKVKTISGCLLT